MLFGSVKQPAMRTFERIRLERDAQSVRLEQQRKARHGPLLTRRRCQAAERCPDRVLHFRRDRHILVRQQRRDPFGRPAAFTGAIGRASCRESVCQYVSIWVVAVSLKKKTKKLFISCTI